MASPRLERVLERAAGICLVAVLLWGGVSGWQFYRASLLPQARVVPTGTPSPVPDPELIREQARRTRLAIDLVGAGIHLRQAGNRAAAIDSFTRALEIDPSNAEARQNLIEMGVVLPVSSPTALSRG